MTDPAFQPLSALANKIADKELSSTELLDHYITRIERHNPQLNAVVAMDLDRAREAAAAADEVLANGGPAGPLHGVPMTIKDAFEVEGLVSTGGVPALKDHMPAQDALAVARLRQAGAVIVGKTNVPAYSGDWQTTNEIYGTTNNPWNLEHTPGGSSGGAAAAVSAGLSAGEIGSDIGGSIRLPAHFCGLFGHKPTYGVVPMRGHIPPAPVAYSEADLAVGGPLGRSAGDVALLFDVLAGDPDDPVRPHPPLGPARVRDVKDLRVAVWLDEPEAGVDVEVAKAVEEAAGALEAAGARVDRAARPVIDFAEMFECYGLLLNGIISTSFPPKVLERLAAIAAGLDPGDRSYEAVQARGATLTYSQLLSVEARRQRIKDAWYDFFQDHDVMLCPPVTVPAIRHDPSPNVAARRITVNGEEAHYFDIMHWAAPATLAYLPATVVPVRRTPDGLPAGVQIIGGHLQDHTTLAVAGMLEELLGGFTPPPDFA